MPYEIRHYTGILHLIGDGKNYENYAFQSRRGKHKHRFTFEVAEEIVAVNEWSGNERVRIVFVPEKVPVLEVNGRKINICHT